MELISYTHYKYHTNEGFCKHQNIARMRLDFRIQLKKFLLNLGIKERFENLSINRSTIEKRQLISDFERLISSSFMGQAFKVLIIRSENLPPFLGF